MRWCWRLLLGLALWCAPSADASAEKRVALVIGNSAYQHAARLANPSNDASAVAKLIKDIGFDVVDFRRDLVGTDLRRAIREFSQHARDADVAIVFYAGHGMELNGSNYLVPTDAKLEQDFDVEDETVPLDRFLSAVEPARQLRLVILDACRDNPFVKKMKRTIATRAVGQGLARIDVTSTDTLIAFAAKAGSVANDGEGAHSPFTAALLKHLPTPGLDIRLVFGRVRDDVLASTRHRQEPFVYGSLGGSDVALVPVPAAPANAAVEVRRDYELAGQVGTPEAWTAFLTQYPTGFYADLAREQRSKLLNAAARQQADAAARKRDEEERRARAAEAERAKAEREKAERDKAQRQELARSEREKADRERAAREEAERAEEERQRRAREQGEAEKSSAKVPETPQIAMLPPAATPMQQAPAMSRLELISAIKTELKRVGCYERKADDKWDSPQMTRSIAKFAKYAKLADEPKEPTSDFLNIIKGSSNHVCPLECSVREVEKNGRCVEITCPRGRTLQNDGSCKKSRDHDRASLPTDIKEKKKASMTSQKGGEGTCSRMKDQLGCNCALKVGGDIYPSPGSYSGYRWRYHNREAFTQCLYASGRR